MNDGSTGISRRDALTVGGALAAAGGWLGLSADALLAQGDSPGSDAASSQPKAYVLPPLPYANDALEPHIDAATMALHHDKHHKSYVDGLNSALSSLETVRKSGAPEDWDKVRALTDAVSFHGSGHALHSVFWTNMKKDGGKEPQGALAKQVDRDFGGSKNLQAQFNSAANRVQGGGWGILAYEPLGGRLIVLAAEKHQNQTVFGCVPVLVLDVWEHAYYLKYQNKRADYVAAFWNVVNWDDVSQRVASAQKLVNGS